MKTNRYITLFSLIILTSVISCKKTEIKPENIFTKIYSDSNSDISYYPLDFLENGNGGYYILGSTSIDTTRTWLSAFIMGTDELGEMTWSVILDKPYVNPISNLINLSGEFYFFCMDEISLGAHLLKINEATHSAELIKTFPEIIYPLAVSKTPDNGFILLSYDRTTRSSSINKIDASFNITWQSKFRVIEDAEEQLIDHLIKTGKNIPFFTGTVGEGSASYYFANGLYNYTLSLLFVNASNGETAGVAQGYRYDGGASSLLPLQGNTFALSRFSFGEHFILPSTTIDVNSISSLSDYGGGKLAEIASDSETRVKKITINGKPSIVFATNTNNNQVIIYIYDLASNELLIKKYLGFGHPVKIASVMQTKDEGLALLVLTMVTGRFKRISMYKIPKEHLK